MVGNSYSQTAGQVGFNGTTTNCGASDTNTYYLTTPIYPSAAPAPQSMSVNYSSSTGIITLQVKTLYIPTNSKVVLDFSPFTTLSARGSCANYAPGLISGNFSTWWSHPSNVYGLPNATMGAWTSLYSGCSKETFVATFTPAALLNCTASDGAKQVLNYQSPSTSLLVISGSLYISVVGPYSISGGESAGYITSSWRMPFQVYYGNTITSVGRTSATMQVSIATYQVFLNTNGNLVVYLVVELTTDTSTYPAGMIFSSGVVGPVGMSTTFSMPLAVNTPSTQTIMYTSSSVPTTGIYDGTYNFNFVLYSCTCAGIPQCPIYTTASVSVPITMRLYQSINATGNLNAALTKYTDNTFTNPVNTTNSTYYDGQRFCIQDALTGLDPADIALYNISVTSVTLCVPNNASIPVIYDGQTNFGCTDQNQRAYLVINSVIVQGTDPSYYSTTLYPYISPSTAGFCINTRISMIDPLTGTTYAPSGVQYVQVQALVTLNSPRPSKRSDSPPQQTQTYDVTNSLFLVQITPAPNMVGNSTGNSSSTGNSTSSPTPTPTQAPPPNLGSKGSAKASTNLSGSQLAGIIVGVIMFVVIVVVLVFFFGGFRKDKKSYTKPKKSKSAMYYL